MLEQIVPTQILNQTTLMNNKPKGTKLNTQTKRRRETGFKALLDEKIKNLNK